MTRLLTVAALALVLVAGGWWVLQPRTAPGSDLLPAGAAQAQQSGDIDTSTIEEMTLGSEDAAVTLIEYASYTCPHCARFHADGYKQLKADYIDTGKIRFIYREVYFDRFGLWASMVARCGGPERFFGITELLYGGQDVWARAGDPVAIVGELRKIGKVAGLTDEQLDACLSDANKAQTLVAWYQENATEDGINSTPSFVLNGSKLENMPYAELSALIDAELN